jgi:hypothetical protein
MGGQALIRTIAAMAPNFVHSITFGAYSENRHDDLAYSAPLRIEVLLREIVESVTARQIGPIQCVNHRCVPLAGEEKLVLAPPSSQDLPACRI